MELSIIALSSLGIAQWYLEQAQLIIEQDCLPHISTEDGESSNQKRQMNWIYVLKGIDQVQEDTHQNGMFILYTIILYTTLFCLLFSNLMCRLLFFPFRRRSFN